jgi:DNA processing protein
VNAVDEDDAAVAALAGLPYMSWDRLRTLLADDPPSSVWDAVRGGRHGPGLARAAARVRLTDVAAAHAAAGVQVRRLGTEAYPGELAEDHECPAALFTLGSLEGLARPRVAIVGTRRCTNYGRDVARELGRTLAEAGVAVVSGLAAGIDGAAHEGALAGGGAPPIGVVGSGLDVVYPRRHARLWERVAQAGALLSEAPLGARPEPWRFPARNRILAALAHVLVVVESHLAGGSMHTVRAAEERDVPVLVVPGPIRSRASAGTNQLLSQGCHPVCDAQDVLAALALRRAGPVPLTLVGSGRVAGAAGDDGSGLMEWRSPPTPEAEAVLDALDWTPTSLDTLLARIDRPPSRVSMALAWLEREGWAQSQSGWWQRC